MLCACPFPESKRLDYISDSHINQVIIAHELQVGAKLDNGMHHVATAVRSCSIVTLTSRPEQRP